MTNKINRKIFMGTIVVLVCGAMAFADTKENKVESAPAHAESFAPCAPAKNSFNAPHSNHNAGPSKAPENKGHSGNAHAAPANNHKASPAPKANGHNAGPSKNPAPKANSHNAAPAPSRNHEPVHNNKGPAPSPSHHGGKRR